MKTANIYDPGATENDYLFMFNGEPVSGTGPVPTGTIQITSNGQHDVSDYATADVNVPQGITPSGSKSITENGTYDVTQYASAVVNVPQGITPSGIKSITENGTYDVTQYASAVVNVPQGGSGLPLLDVINVSEDTRAVNIDLTPYQSYDVVLIFSDVTLSASDWLYYVKNGSSPTGGTYGSSVIHHYGMCFGQWLGSSDNRKFNLIPSGGGYGTSEGSVSNLYIYAYSANKNILSGSKFYVYGSTYANIL